MSRRRCLARAARWSRATAQPRRRSRRAAPPCRCRHGRPAHSSRCEETLLTASLPVHRHGVPCSPPPSLAPPAPRPAERRRRGRSRTRKAAAAPPPPDSLIPNWSDRYPLTAQRRHPPPPPPPAAGSAAASAPWPSPRRASRRATSRSVQSAAAPTRRAPRCTRGPPEMRRAAHHATSLGRVTKHERLRRQEIWRAVRRSDRLTRPSLINESTRGGWARRQSAAAIASSR